MICELFALNLPLITLSVQILASQIIPAERLYHGILGYILQAVLEP